MATICQFRGTCPRRACNRDTQPIIIALEGNWAVHRTGRIGLWAGLGLLLAVCASAQTPDPATAAYDRGMAEAKAGGHQAAIGHFDEAIRLNPADAKAYNARGEAYDHLHQENRAEADYDQ